MLGYDANCGETNEYLQSYPLFSSLIIICASFIVCVSLGKCTFITYPIEALHNALYGNIRLLFNVSSPHIYIYPITKQMFLHRRIAGKCI